MIRSLLSLVVGLFAAIIVNTFAHAANMKLWPPGQVASTGAAIAAMPTGARILLVAGWLLAAFAGALVTTGVARHRTKVALVPGVLIAALNFQYAMASPHPLWVKAALVLLPVPMAWLGAELGVRMVTPKPTDGGAWTGGTK